MKKFVQGRPSECVRLRDPAECQPLTAPPSLPRPASPSLLPALAGGRRARREQGLEVPSPWRPHLPPVPASEPAPPRQGNRGPLLSPPGPGSRGQRRSPGGARPQGWGQLRRPRVSGGRRGTRAGQGPGAGWRGVRGVSEGVRLGALMPGRGGRRGPAGWRGSGAGLPRESWSWGCGVPARCWRRRSGWALASPPRPKLLPIRSWVAQHPSEPPPTHSHRNVVGTTAGRR